MRWKGMGDDEMWECKRLPDVLVGVKYGTMPVVDRIWAAFRSVPVAYGSPVSCGHGSNELIIENVLFLALHVVMLF